MSTGAAAASASPPTWADPLAGPESDSGVGRDALAVSAGVGALPDALASLDDAPLTIDQEVVADVRVLLDLDVLALDAKINIEDNALFRQERLLELRDPSQEDEKEREAAEHDLNYVSLDGDIACMVNGAGLAMATMDLLKLHG